MRKRTLGRRYRLIEEIGSGGMGTVYRARDTRTGHTVAVKILHPHLTRDAEYLERFRRETEITRSLASPNIIRVLDFGEDGSDRFFVMEYVEGVSLRKMLRQRGALPQQQALDIATQIATALEEAHAKGVVHRDIKPENIVIAADGRVKVGDFGIARAQDHTRLTLTGAVMGTVQYMAPELLTGGGDARSDIYSLGVILYQMLVGAPPFEAPTPWEILQRHREAPMPPLPAPPELPAVIVDLVGRCLSKDPAGRPQTAVELVAQLAIPDDSSSLAPAVWDSPKITRARPLHHGRSRRFTSGLWAGLISSIVLASGVVGLSWYYLPGIGNSELATTDPTAIPSLTQTAAVGAGTGAPAGEDSAPGSASGTPTYLFSTPGSGEPSSAAGEASTPVAPASTAVPAGPAGGAIAVGAASLVAGNVEVPVNLTGTGISAFTAFNIHLR